MPEETTKPIKAEKPVSKTATVRVLKTGITYRNSKCSRGHVINSMDIDEVKIRVDAGEVALIQVNP
jgi:hypothetical protein